MIKYNPIDILNDDQSKRFINECLQHQNKKFLPTVDDAVTSAIKHLTGYSNFLASGLLKIQEINISDRTNTLLKEQIEYVTNNPYRLREQVELCLIITSSYFYYVSCFKDNVNSFSTGVKTIFRCIKHLSITKGLVESVLEDMENGAKEKWDVLRYPLALVLCSYIKEKSISKNIAEDLVQSILNFGKHTSDIKNLMGTSYSSLLSKKIIHSLTDFCESPMGEYDNIMSCIKDFKTWYIDFKGENSIFNKIEPTIHKLAIVGMEGSGKTTLLNNLGANISNEKYHPFTVLIDGFELDFSEGTDFNGNDHLSNDEILRKIIINSNDIIFVADVNKMLSSNAYKNNITKYLSKIQNIIDNDNGIIELNVSLSHVDIIEDTTYCHDAENLIKSINPKVEVENIFFNNLIDKTDCISIIKKIYNI